jgi:resuscitation-promoting factor RpfA
VRRVQVRQRVRSMRRVVGPHRAWLERVARCESGGDWSINTGTGFFGGLQFTLSSWRLVGGRGWPHQASKLRQMYHGVELLRVQGPGAWPVCSRIA